MLLSQVFPGRSTADVTTFYYRTFNSDDLIFLFYALQDIYINKGGLENIANDSFSQSGSIKRVIISIRKALLQTPHLKRSEI